MRKQHQVIIEALEDAGDRYFEKKIGSLRLEYINKYFWRIFYHETAIISVVQNQIILRTGGWRTTSTSENLRGLFEGIFNMQMLYNWGGIKDEFGIPHIWEDEKIELYGIGKATYRENLKNLY